MARKQGYKVTTRLVHGPEHSAKWDFEHHVTPPLSSSTTYRLDSAERGSRGFAEFGRLVRDSGDAPGLHLRPPGRADALDPRGRAGRRRGRRRLPDLRLGHGRDLGHAADPDEGRRRGRRAPDPVRLHALAAGQLASALRPGGEARRRSATSTALREAISERTRVIYFESPVNPTLELIDIAAGARAGRRAQPRPAAGAAHPDRDRQHLRHALLPAPAGARRRHRGAQPDQEPGRLRHRDRRRRDLPQVAAGGAQAVPQGPGRDPLLQVGLGHHGLRPADPGAAAQAPAVHRQEGRHLAGEAGRRRRASSTRGWRATPGASWPSASTATATATSRRAA